MDKTNLKSSYGAVNIQWPGSSVFGGCEIGRNSAIKGRHFDVESKVEVPDFTSLSAGVVRLICIWQAHLVPRISLRPRTCARIEHKSTLPPDICSGTFVCVCADLMSACRRKHRPRCFANGSFGCSREIANKTCR